ncbi:MAG: hypothetical protein N3A38_03055 [Planctomycetota bacterium]|nr:hypothetical protein [Planctomycetota bacterium]
MRNAGDTELRHMGILFRAASVFRPGDGEILGVAWDGRIVSAAILRAAADGGVAASVCMEEAAPDLPSGLAAVSRAVRAGGARMPARALLLCPEVHVAVLRLPVDPGRPLPPRQMRELLKWELEPYIAAGGDRGGRVACGWAAMDEKPSDGKWRWVAAGISEAHRRRFTESFAAIGIRLLALYPLVGCACACLNGSAGASCAVFEYRGDRLCYARFSGDRIASLRWVAVGRAPDDPVRSCLDLFEPEAERVWLAGRWPDAGAVARALEAELGRPCSPFPGSGRLMSGGATATGGTYDLMGAAAHLLGRSARGNIAFVPARDPEPPVWKSVPFLIGAAATVLAAVTAATAVRLDRKADSMAEVIAANGLLRGRNAEIGRLDAKIAEIERCISSLRTALPRRQQTAPILLRTLRDCCPEEIIIKRLAWTESGGIAIHGWGLTARAVQAFKIELQDRLPGLILDDARQPVRKECGWAGLEGYSFEIRLTPAAGAGDRRDSP